MLVIYNFDTNKFSQMTFRFTSRSAFTALIAAFILHNAEEAISICKFHVQSPVALIQLVSCKQFIIAVSFLSVVGLLAYLFAMGTKKLNTYYLISTGLAAAVLFNVLMPHIFVSLYTFNYIPGLVSAVALNLPLSILVLLKNRPHYSRITTFFKHIFIFLIIGYLVFAGIMSFVKFFF